MVLCLSRPQRLLICDVEKDAKLSRWNFGRPFGRGENARWQHVMDLSRLDWQLVLEAMLSSVLLPCIYGND